MSASPLFARANAWLLRIQFNADRRIDFYQSLATLLDGGRALNDALQTMRDNAMAAGGKSARARKRAAGSVDAVMLSQAIDAIGQGEKLHGAVKSWLPPHEVAILAAGQEAGDVVGSCDSASQSIEDRRGMTAAALSALAYPIGLMFGICGILALMGYGIVPDLVRQGPVEAWKGLTYLMIRVGLFVNSYGPFLAAALVILLAFVVWSLPNLTGRFRNKLDNFAPWSVYRVLVGTTVMLNLADMMAAGIPLESALAVILETSTKYLRERIDNTLKGIRLGMKLGDALHHAEHNFPSPRGVRFLQDLGGEKDFDKALAKFARRELKRSQREIAKKSAVLRIVLMVLMGVLVFLFFLGVMGISQAARRSFNQS